MVDTVQNLVGTTAAVVVPETSSAPKVSTGGTGATSGSGEVGTTAPASPVSASDAGSVSVDVNSAMGSVMDAMSDMPPPIDNELYYGSMLLIKHDTAELSNGNVSDLSTEDWEKYYEKLFGGFEDLGEEDSYSDEEEIPEHMKTKEGYSKEDGFIVDDDEEEDDDYIPEEDEEEEEEAETTTDAEEEDGMGQDSDIDDGEEEEEEEEEEDEDYDSEDLGSELSEESYIDSDSD